MRRGRGGRRFYQPGRPPTGKKTHSYRASDAEREETERVIADATLKPSITEFVEVMAQGQFVPVPADLLKDSVDEKLRAFYDLRGRLE